MRRVKSIDARPLRRLSVATLQRITRLLPFEHLTRSLGESLDDPSRLQTLIRAGADVRAPPVRHLLSVAVNRGLAQSARVLLESGVPANTDDDRCLFLASSKNHLPIVRLLLAHGARADSWDGRCLWIAAHEGHVDVFRVLCESLDVSRDTHARPGGVSWKQWAKVVLEIMLRGKSAVHPDFTEWWAQFSLWEAYREADARRVVGARSTVIGRMVAGRLSLDAESFDTLLTLLYGKGHQFGSVEVLATIVDEAHSDPREQVGVVLRRTSWENARKLHGSTNHDLFLNEVVMRASERGFVESLRLVFASVPLLRPVKSAPLVWAPSLFQAIVKRRRAVVDLFVNELGIWENGEVAQAWRHVDRLDAFLRCACEYSWNDWIERLVETEKADPRRWDNNALCWAVKRENEQAIRLLVKHGADPFVDGRALWRFLKQKRNAACLRALGCMATTSPVEKGQNRRRPRESAPDDAPVRNDESPGKRVCESPEGGRLVQSPLQSR